VDIGAKPIAPNVLRCEWSDFGGNGLAPNSGYLSDSAEGRPASSAVQSKKAAEAVLQSIEVGQSKGVAGQKQDEG